MWRFTLPGAVAPDRYLSMNQIKLKAKMALALNNWQWLINQTKPKQIASSRIWTWVAITQYYKTNSTNEICSDRNSWMPKTIFKLIYLKKIIWLIDWLIDFNGISTRPGLFYALSSGNRVYYMFIFTSYVVGFFFFFWWGDTIQSNSNHF